MTAIVFVVGQKGELMSDMTNAAAIDLLDNLIGMVDDNQGNDYDSALHIAIDALKTQVDTDTVSRKAVLDAVCEELDSIDHVPQWVFDRLTKKIENLPPSPSRPQWIPVTERLPEGTVLVTVETKMFKHKYICEAVWIPRWSKIADFDSWEDCSEYNEDEDEYYVLEGWYERIHNWDEYSFVGIEDKVIAWKPLPQPYKEGGAE